ncbi:hypothetical protein ES703_72095 [subsurface metagenome]
MQSVCLIEKCTTNYYFRLFGERSTVLGIPTMVLKQVQFVCYTPGDKIYPCTPISIAWSLLQDIPLMATGSELGNRRNISIQSIN